MKALELSELITTAVRQEVAPLKAEITSLREKLETAGRAIKTISDIAREYGYSRETVERTPWLMPNWGRSDFTGPRKRWYRETYTAWFAIGSVARQREWDRMPIKEKDKLRGRT